MESNSQRPDSLIQYIQDDVVLMTTKIGEDVFLGWACYNADLEESPFDKKKGKMIAKKRAEYYCASGDSINMVDAPVHLNKFSDSPDKVIADKNGKRVLPFVMNNPISLEKINHFIERSKLYFVVDKVKNYSVVL